MTGPKRFPLERIENERMTIKAGYRGFGCAAELYVNSDRVLPVCIFAGTAEDAAAVCEFLTGADMNMELVVPTVLGSDPKA
jgi:hypothetical protein